MSNITDPYIRARKEYDDITHNLNASKHNWQRLCFMLAAVLIISVAGHVVAIKKSHVVPYIVEVDQLGRAMAINAAKDIPLNDERIIKAFVYQYVTRARSVLSDPEALRSNLKQVYQESIKSVQSNFLDGHYKDHNPFEYAQHKGTCHVEMLIFLKESENTYAVEWREIERNYENQLLSESRYKALISVAQIPHSNAEQYQEDPLNPFGLYVTSLSWSRLM